MVSPNHLESTFHVRSLTPRVIEGDRYTEGATSNMHEAKNPLNLSGILRVMMTTIVCYCNISLMESIIFAIIFCRFIIVPPFFRT